LFKIQKRINSEDFFKLLLIVFWGKGFWCSYLRAVFLRIPIVSMIADWIIPAVTVLCVLGAINYITKKVTARDILFILCAAVAYCINLLIYKETSEYLVEIAFDFWLMVLPLYFVGLCIKEENLKLLYKISLLNLWLFFVYSALFGSLVLEEQALYSGAMGRAYRLLPQVLMLALFELEKPSKFGMLTLIMSSVYLFFCGTRGAVLCLFVFLALFVIVKKPLKNHPVLYLFMGFAMILLVLFYNEILMWLGWLAEQVGMSDRIIRKILSEELFTSDGRTYIRNAVRLGILERPVLGYGIAGDRALVSSYSHNLLLELLVSFGIPAGSVVFVCIVVIILNGYKKAADRQIKDLVLMLFCSSFVKLLVSSSYLLEPLFFLLMGVCVKQMRNAGRRINSVVELSEDNYENM